jgi:hypothetical protein
MDIGLRSLKHGINKISGLSQTGFEIEYGEVPLFEAIDDIGKIFNKGIDGIDFLLDDDEPVCVTYDLQRRKKLQKLIKKYETEEITITGRIFAANFENMTCKVSKTDDNKIDCFFNEKLVDTIYKSMRKNVIIKGRAKTLFTGEVKNFWIESLEIINQIDDLQKYMMKIKQSQQTSGALLRLMNLGQVRKKVLLVLLSPR